MNRIARTLAATLIAPLAGCGQPEQTTGPVELAAVGQRGPLGAPSGLRAVALSELAIAVSWADNSTSESGFEVYQSTAGGPFVLVATTGANVRSYSAAGLAIATSYCYRVRGVQVAPKLRYSPFSGTACATTLAFAAPSPVSAVPMSESVIAVNWQDRTTIETGFEVHRSAGGEPFTLVASTGANVQGFTFAGLTPSTSYCHKVRAVRAGEPTLYSPFTETVCATTSPLTRPEQAYYTWAVEQPGGAVEVTWADRSSNEAGFRIERSDSDYGAPWEVAGIVGPDVATFTTDQPVCYQVIAFNAAGEAPPSDPACAAPAAPGNVAITVLGDGTREVTWADNSSIEDIYEVWLAHGPNCCGGCDASYFEYPIDFLPANTTSYRTTTASTECQAITLILMASRRGVQSYPAGVLVP